jgi:dipeptidyl aminopeptidase/acylaminoacyl peptidase
LILTHIELLECWKQNDITDSVYWAITEGYADKERIGITGISFGGFCTLAGITFTPGTSL